VLSDFPIKTIEEFIAYAWVKIRGFFCSYFDVLGDTEKCGAKEAERLNKIV